MPPRHYFGWGWMENLGVVPWLRFLTFLLAPLFCFLFALRVLVFLVNETMRQLLVKGGLTLLIPQHPVKAWMLWGSLLLVASPPQVWGGEATDHVISIGEHLEIPSRGLKRFSVTDQQVISYKWLEQQVHFLVEGKKLGYSELIIWDGGGQKTTHRFYVLSKRSFLKLKRIQKTLEAMGLKAAPQGNILVARGRIYRQRDYFILHKILRQHSKVIYLDVKLAKSLRNHIIGKVYQILFDEALPGVSCQVERIQITCFYQKVEQVEKSIAHKLKKDYAIKLVAKSRGQSRQNYRVQLLVFQFERTDGQEISLGLDQLQTTGAELFSHGINALVDKNQVLLKKNHIKVSTLAWPETMVVPYQESTLEMGAEIPYPLANSQGESGSGGKQIEWKFAGIRLKLSLSPYGHQVRVNYLTEVKRQGKDGQVSGGLNQSTANLRLGQVQQIFQIGLQTSNTQRGALPFVHQIPLLGKLFSSFREGHNFKKIVGYLRVEKGP